MTFYWTPSIPESPSPFLLASEPSILEHNSDFPLEGFSDMVQMPLLNEPEILYNLKLRYKNIEIFTYIGPSLLIMNPYREISHYSDENLEEILLKKNVGKANIYAVALNTALNLEANQRNQAIVISGESGAGKTETTKHCMKFLTYQKGKNEEKNEKNFEENSMKNSTNFEENSLKNLMKNSTNLEENSLKIQIKPISQRILDCNPILEAFGNAKTVRNDNSSRFGKYVRLLISQKKPTNAVCGIVGATITSYLLEKSRVIDQAINERNFHIFYYILSQENKENKRNFGLEKDSKAEDFNYLKKSSCFSVNSINDSKGFLEVSRSLEDLGFTSIEIHAIFAILSSILLIGNIEFSDDKLSDICPVFVKNTEEIKKIAFLIGFNDKNLEDSWVWKVREVNKQRILSPLSLKECENLRDSFSKNLYEKLFFWLVKRLNLTVFPIEIANSKLNSVRKSIKNIRNSIFSPETTRNSIGLLDIFGFENFIRNSFEQLCINFTNEKLQQLYIAYIYKSEESELSSQGFLGFSSEFVDNQPIIDLIEKYPISILDLLDENSMLGSSTDENLLSAFVKNLGKNPYFKGNLLEKNFIICHSAKNVIYSIKGFRDKNFDEITKEIMDICEKSENFVIKEAFTEKKKENKKTARFLAGKFKGEIKELMRELSACDVSFVRCVKPNEQKKPDFFDEKLVLLQIRYLGLLDSINIRKNGFVLRKNYRDFYQKFIDFFEKKTKEKDEKMLVMEFFEKKTVFEENEVFLGKSKIFIKEKGCEKIAGFLKEIQKEKLKKIQIIQRQYNVYKFKKNVKFGVKGLRLVLKAIIRLQSKRKAIKFRRIFLEKKKFIAILARISKKKEMKNAWEKFRKRIAVFEEIRKKTKALRKIIEIYRRKIMRIWLVRFRKTKGKQQVFEKKRTVRFSVVDNKEKEEESKKNEWFFEKNKKNSKNLELSEISSQLLEISLENKEKSEISSENKEKKMIPVKNIAISQLKTSTENPVKNTPENPVKNTKENPPENPVNNSTENPLKNSVENTVKKLLFSHEKPPEIEEFPYHFSSLFTNRESLMLGNFSSLPKSPDCYLDFETLDQEFLHTIELQDFLIKSCEILQTQRRFFQKISKEKLLNYQKNPIKTSLQRLSAEKTLISRKIHKFILKYCYDQPSNSSNLNKQVEKLLFLVISKPLDPEITDETYLLLIKQIRNNHNKENKLRVFRLLGIVCSVRAPSLRLYFPVMNFLYSYAKTVFLEENSRFFQ